MANTLIHLDIIDDAVPVTLFLKETEAGQVAPNAAGYVLASGSEDWEWVATVTEACVGIYRVHAQDGDGLTVAQGYVWIEADDTDTYRASADYAVLKARSELAVVDANVDATLADTAAMQPQVANTEVIVADIQTTADTILVDTADMQPRVVAIEADTNELQTDWVDGGRLDLKLDGVESQTNKIGSGAAFVGAPVLEDGLINGPLVIGDDYNEANSRAFSWDFDAIPGFTIGVAAGKFGMEHATKPATHNFIVNSTSVTDNGDGTWKVKFDVDKTDSDAFIAGYYDWSVEIHEGGEEITIAKNTEPRERVYWAEKQT